MNKLSIERAAAILVKARRSMAPLRGLPDGLKPKTIDEAHAIQDAVTHQLGKLIAGFKAMKPANDDATRGVIYGGTIFPSPAAIPGDPCAMYGIFASPAISATCASSSMDVSSNECSPMTAVQRRECSSV